MKGIGHNNPPSLKEEYQGRFLALCDKLRRLGLKGEVALTGEVIMISTGRDSSSLWRKSLKIACKNCGVNLIETRPQKGFYVFSIFI